MENDYAVVIRLRENYNQTICITYSGCNLSKEDLKELILEDLNVEIRVLPRTPSMEFKLKEEDADSSK